MSGRIVHFEIPYNSKSRAQKFYSEAFGWNISEFPGMDYTIASTGPVTDQGMPAEPGFINGGLFQRSEDTPWPTAPVITVAVDSIEEAQAKIAGLGGFAVGDKVKVGDMGYAAYFKDTEGNVVGLWENA